jgi:riboflavin synthase
VNLERAIAAGGRFGGHFVQGHVDATVSILASVPDGNSLRLTFKLPAPSATPDGDLLPYIVPKGYVTLDGASLTITEVSDSDRTFGVMLIAHTQSKITLPTRSVGEQVNLEADMVGKYVHRSVIASLGVVGSKQAV